MLHTNRLSIPTLLLALTLGGCGAKTGLLIESRDAAVEADVEIEADIEVEADIEAEADIDICEPEPVTITPTRAEVTFVIDRSSSMAWELEGHPGIPGYPSRWDLLRDALSDALLPIDHRLEVGAKFFPRRFYPYEPHDEFLACQIDRGMDLSPAPFNAAELLEFFHETFPEGGTPTTAGLEEVRSFLVGSSRLGVSRFVVLATDGGPNCDPDATFGPHCVCTGPPEYCEPGTGGTYNCLDDERVLRVIEGISGGLGVPVFVVGIDDPSRPDLADLLDEMAVTGGRPRPEPSERRFYSVRRPEELGEALGSITESIARCVFTVSPRAAGSPRLEVRLDGELIPYDPDRLFGWDWTDVAAGELTFFGEACERATLPDVRVTASVACLE